VATGDLIGYLRGSMIPTRWSAGCTLEPSGRHDQPGQADRQGILRGLYLRRGAQHDVRFDAEQEADAVTHVRKHAASLPVIDHGHGPDERCPSSFAPVSLDNLAVVPTSLDDVRCRRQAASSACSSGDVSASPAGRDCDRCRAGRAWADLSGS
jgi:hypothetical protein